jgi:hypothetical protein
MVCLPVYLVLVLTLSVGIIPFRYTLFYVRSLIWTFIRQVHVYTTSSCNGALRVTCSSYHCKVDSRFALQCIRVKALLHGLWSDTSYAYL